MRDVHRGELVEPLGAQDLDGVAAERIGGRADDEDRAARSFGGRRRRRRGGRERPRDVRGQRVAGQVGDARCGDDPALEHLAER